MRIPDVVYHRPDSVAEAVAIAASLGDGVRYLAGGTELVTDLKKGRASARHLVSLRRCEALRGIRREGDVLRIGALSRLEEVARSVVIREALPVLAEAAGSIGCVQIRQQGTIGGNFCGAVPCADTPPACLVADASVTIVGRAGARSVTARDFFVGPRETVLEPAEILAEVVVPVPAEGSGAAYERFALRKGMAVAVASVAAFVRIDGDVVADARIALGAVAPVPWLAKAAGEALIGETATEETFARAAGLAAGEAAPICDVRGSDEYRREIVSVLTRRALTRAVGRARGGGA